MNKNSVQPWNLCLTLAVAGGQVAIAPALIFQFAHTLLFTNAAVASDLASPIAQANTVQVTGVTLESGDTGLQIQLETAGELSAPTSEVSGNALIIEFPNAVLMLSDEFIEFEPADDIAVVQITELSGEQIQVVITGTDAPPTVEISATPVGLTLSAAPGIAQAGGTEEEALQILVTGEEGSDYFTPAATTATRTDSPLSDIPQSIQVIPRQIIEDEQATGIEDVLDNVAGVNFQGNDDGRGTRFTIRGFGSFGSPILRDGFRVFNAGNNAAAPEIANLEQIEVLKGPASVLYGEADPGGLINLVTKKPLSEPYYNLQLQAGSRDFFSPSIDLSGPITDDGDVRYRLNALYRQEDSFRDLDNNFERFFIAPTIAWDISDRTSLTASLEYIDDNDPADFGLPAFGDSVADIPLDRVVVSNPDDTLEKEYLRTGYTLEHRFSDNWRIRNEFRYVSDEYSYGVIAVPVALNETTGDLNRILARQFNERDNYSLYTNVQGRFDTGSVEHNLLFGVDLAREEDFGGGEAAFSPLANPEWFNTINIFNPDYSFTKPALEDAPASLRNDSTVDRLGVYLQDQIYLTDNLIVLAGLRYDTVDQETTSTTSTAFGDIVDETEQNDDAVTPRIGVVYQPTDTISLYGSYAQSFTPNGGTDISGSPLEPETGDGFEVGVKADLIPNRLAATLAYFNITRQNVATADPNDPLLQALIATGEQRSQGVELDVNGEILPGWNIIASYAYTDAEITEDNTFDVGNRLPGVPEHSASLWSTYRIQSGDLEGLGFGLGLNYVGERKGGLDNSFEVDDYFLTSAAAFYRRNNWRFQVNIDNLFDIDYIESVGAGRTRGIYPGDPLTVRASVSVEF
ncbi:MAG: TonB-dependent siderophore receptor [Cyanobacteria bacterium P01_F01_bin.116]